MKKFKLPQSVVDGIYIMVAFVAVWMFIYFASIFG